MVKKLKPKSIPANEAENETAVVAEDNTEVVSSARKSTKHKINTKNNKAKKSKRSKTNSESSATDDEEDLHEPTAVELDESKKPDNQSSIVTVRQKKKAKHQERLLARKDKGVDKEIQRNDEYLKKWKETPAEWKFEKLRQISIQQSVFDEQKISAETWVLALEYLSGSKGAAKENIIKLAEDRIDQLDKKCALQESEEERQAILDSVEYQRARDLLQSFN